MIDGFAIVLTHTLLLIAFWLLRERDDLDDEAPPAEHHRPAGFGWRGEG
ncbi:MAG: hypothetical protein AABZ45_08435 [Pseudomonadota bacterium]